MGPNETHKLSHSKGNQRAVGRSQFPVPGSKLCRASAGCVGDGRDGPEEDRLKPTRVREDVKTVWRGPYTGHSEPNHASERNVHVRISVTFEYDLCRCK